MLPFTFPFPSSISENLSLQFVTLSTIFQDWDVSTDPELLKVLNVAKLLGRTAPPTVKTVKKVPMFDLVPTQIRRLNNPRAKVKSVMASLQRNLAGYGPSGGEQD